MSWKGSERSRHEQRRWGTTDDSHSGVGPELAFAGSTLACVAAWGALHSTFAPVLVRPAVATLIFVLAAVIAVAAWRHRRMDPNNVTYADVAGALTLIGLFVSATIDPHEFVRAVFGDWSSSSMEPEGPKLDG